MHRLAHIHRLAFVIAVMGLAPQSVFAQQTSAENGDDAERVFGVEFLTGTTAPLDVWTGVNFVLYERLVLTASIGRAVYGGVAGSILRNHGADDAAAIVQPLLSDGWMFRLGIGVRPFGRQGPEALVGFARMNASASWDASAFDLSSSFGSLSADVGINMIYAELGWSIDILGPVFIRPAIGFTRALGSSVDLDASAATSGQASAALDAAEAVVQDAIDTYGVTPTLSLSIGARF